jgi:hypothetical protein
MTTPRKKAAWIDYRKPIKYAQSVPRAYQPRQGGPPLLFGTDMRMTVLITLAMANGPMRCARIWRHIRRTNKGCLHELTRIGIATAWEISYGCAFAALDPAHPAAVPMRALLRKLGALFAFSTPPSDPGRRFRRRSAVRSATLS